MASSLKRLTTKPSYRQLRYLQSADRAAIAAHAARYHQLAVASCRAKAEMPLETTGRPK
jgi:hypothetical protein